MRRDEPAVNGGARTALVIRTSSAQETHSVGAALGRSLAGFVVVSLEGPLGSGKTVLAQGICDGLGVAEPVTSPSYTLQQIYTGRDGRRIVHMDCFRLGGDEELEALDFGDLVDDDTVVLVEWGERALGALGSEVIRIALEPGSGDDRRIVIRVPPGVDRSVLEGAA